MSEGDVSLIRDEDVLRRMWQQTEDFSRKKEIRAHMYKLREERLRNLYSPEPPTKHGTGCEFTSPQGHVKSFADQTFQSMKSKEVRDAGSPPKEFTYRGQDLKELSNAGWNVESENKTTNDGHTHVKSVQATIEGRYDVDGGHGQFAARDQHTQAATEYRDDNTSLKRNESSSNTAASEQVVRQTDDGTHFSSTTSSSTSTSKVQQISSTKVSNDSVPYITSDDYDRQTNNDNCRNEQSMTKRDVTNDYEQSSRRNVSDQGELVARKIDYPDDNTKIVVETRLLPDGTRVTSTRREFRAPIVHSSRSEQHSQQTRSETKSHKTSTQQTSDTKEFTSKIIHQNVEDQSTNIVDSQKNSDEHDFKRQTYMHNDSTNTLREQKDCTSQHTTDKKDINKMTDKLNSEDIQGFKNEKEHCESLILEERSSEIKRNERTQEFSERKVTSEQYQTTYNTDYTQKKISNDWSPTHQAWASTLRAETPTSTVPSTRASSPGARTYQSSTSSLRSSVSPDKMTRKPPSRGASPSKVGTHSPTRTSSDRYSNYSVSETKTTRYTSPESKPPHGRSPTRSSCSPDKYQRTSVSPDKISKEFPHRSFTSPDRKTVSPENLPRQSFSPDRKYTSNNISPESYPRSTSPSKMQGKNTLPSPMRSNQSPSRDEDEPNTRKIPTEPRNRTSVSPQKKLHSSSPTRGYSPTKTIQGKTNPNEKHTAELRDVSPTKDHASSYTQHKPSLSPERKLNQQPDKLMSDLPSNPRQSSSSPERKPGYMRPTVASQHLDSHNLKSNPNKATEITKISSDNYTLIDEETKMYSRTDRENVENYTKTTNIADKYTRTTNKTPSPTRSVPSVDSPDYCKREPTPKPTLRKNSRSPSPPKGPVTFTDHTVNTMETNNFKTYQTDVNTNTYNIKDINTLQNIKTSVNYNTYDKKQQTMCPNDETKIQTTDSLTSREKSPKKNLESPPLTNKKSPRQSVSPVKPFGKDSHIKTTTDFITTEKTTEELNKKNILKNRSRQLVTPSTSPTRKPKIDDTAPSTGQSSPTTSVSGFIYFGSPRVETSVVTDLDEQESYTETTDLINTNMTHERPKSLDVKRSPSPSKIPCRSPSTEKNISPTTEHMPRKSSLKKPSVTNKVSPTEKPPSNFRVSPTTENLDYEHIIVKKDRPDKEDLDKTIKPKPPLERRETYEDRCRKILGMMDEDKKKTISKNKTSPSSVSPTNNKTDEKCFDYNHQTKSSKSQSSTNEFIKYEKEKTDCQNKSQNFTKYPSSRDSSPTKLQDIISTNLYETSDEKYNTISHQEENTSLETKENENILITHRKSIEETHPVHNISRASPDKNVDKDTSMGHTFEKKPEQHENNKKSNRTSPSRAQPKQNCSPDRKLKPQNLFSTNKEPGPEKNNINVKSSSHVIRQETYDVDESQVLSESNLPREPKCTPNPNKHLPSRDIEAHKSRRSPSPKKTVISVIEKTEDLIVSEREKEILDRVQQSLRKLSPNRNEKSPSRGKSPTKTTSNNQNIEILTNVHVDKSEVTSKSEKNSKSETYIEERKCSLTKQKQSKEPNDGRLSKLPSRNTSPVKKTSPHGPVMGPESPNKSRSISPKKPILSVERPQSPQIQKTSGIKPREPVSSYSTKKQIAPNKTEKNIITTDTKKTVTKQNSFINKSSTTTSKLNQTTPNKTNELETKRVTHKNQQNVLKKEPELKVTRAASDTSIKIKMTSPQRMKSKPEIQTHNGSTMRTTKQTITVTRLSKPTISVSQSKLPSKPKSATTLNTSTDEDDIIIDVEQAKSSRENSPDRICPTPINFSDDVGTPRYPDEVNEPDDEFRQRTYNTIHETETIVDDIVEICEDDELFVKRNDNNLITEKDECLLSVNDKVSNYTNKVDSMLRTKDATKHFKDTEKRVHSDYNVKSDECLLTVSEKVNKFTKGSIDRDNKSPSRRIVDEYDNSTLYQDDYTKLSVNDKAHLFVETAENIKQPKPKTITKVERPDLTNVDESLKSDDCLLSVSDKVNKFVKTAEQFLNSSQETNEKEIKIKEQHEIIMKKIIDDEITDNDVPKKSIDENTEKSVDAEHLHRENRDEHTEKRNSFAKETASSHAKSKDVPSQNVKPNEKTPVIKITTLRSKEAVKKAKALFENIASTQKTDTTKVKTTKLTDIGVIKKSPKTDSTIVLHPSLEDGSPDITDVDSEIDARSEKQELHKYPTNKHTTLSYPQPSLDKPSSNPTNLMPHAPETTRNMSPMRRTIESTTSKMVSVSEPVQRAQSPYATRTEHEKTPQEKVPGYQRPTKTSQMKEEIKTVEESEVSSRRGSGKFGVELRRTSVERSTTSSERRRSVEHHQPCIEDIFDLDLLEQMLEKVVGYEQRRRIRAQIRIAKKRMESNMDTHTKTTRLTTITVSKSKSPDRRQPKSPERQSKLPSQETISPNHQSKQTPQRTSCDRNQPKDQTLMVNGQVKEAVKLEHESRHQPRSPGHVPKPHNISKSPARQPSPDKKTRTSSPSKTPVMKPKTNRFNEYATAYLKKAGVNESNKVKVLETKVKKSTDSEDRKTEKHIHEENVIETKSTISKSYTERTSSKDTIEVTQINGKRTPSPEKKRSPERRAQTPVEQKTETPAERLREKSPSPVIKRQLSDLDKKESTTKTVHQIDKKLQPKRTQEEKPSWVTNRNLKKITSETRSFSSKKIETEKPKYRAPSPSKVITKPIDVITSSYGPGPLDADGKPLFGIKALRNGATNYQVKGTVIRQEFHSRNGGEPEGSVSVTAYSNSPEELERLLQCQGDRPSRLHGLAAITTTKKFGGTTGNTYKDIHTREERAALDQFTHSDRRVVDSRVEITDVSSSDRAEERLQEILHCDESTGEDKRTGERREWTDDIESNERTEKMEKTERSHRREDKKTVRQSSVKSLTEKYIKNASEAPKTSSGYPKAGLILRTANMKDSVSSDSSLHAGLARTDSEHSLGSAEEVMVTSSTDRAVRTTTSTDRAVRTTTSTDRAVRTTTNTDRAVRTTAQSDRAGRPTTHADRSGRTTVTTTTTTSRSRAPASFLDSSTKVTGVQDILTRMKNADIVIQEGDSSEDSEARALLNKFLGATVLMAGMQGYVTEGAKGKLQIKQETVRSSGGKVTSSVEELDLDQCWDERTLRKLLDECTDPEQRRRLRARIRSLMAEQEACATAVTEALAAAGEVTESGDGDTREEEEVTTVTSSVRRNSSEKTISSSTTTKTTKVIESMTRPAPKPVSPFAKFRQLEKQNSTNSPNSPKSPQSPGSPSQPLFKFTDPALQASALTIKERLLQWCRDKTRDYENVKLENFSTSWADGLAFCALLHHFLPETFDYSKLTPEKRRHNFTLAFKVADEKAGIYPLLDVDDMVAMRKPDWKCVFTYVQSIHRRFKDQN